MTEKKRHVTLRLPESLADRVEALVDRLCDLGVKDVGPDSLTVSNPSAAYRVVLEAGVKEVELAPQGRCDGCSRPITKDNPILIWTRVLGKETRKCKHCRDELVGGAQGTSGDPIWTCTECGAHKPVHDCPNAS